MDGYVSQLDKICDLLKNIMHLLVMVDDCHNWFYWKKWKRYS